MAFNEVLLLVKAKDEATGVFAKVSASAQGLGKSMGGMLKVGGLAAGAGIGFAALAAGNFIKKAAEEQVGIQRLQTALKTLDAAHRGDAAAVENVIRSRERLAFADDDLRDSLSLLVVQTGDYEEAVRRQAIAMDVARGTGIDLQTASKLLGKINEETTNTFARYGIVIAKGTSETEALAEIQRRFSGQSQAFAGTATAKWKIFNNQMDNIKESIGGALLPVVTALGAALSEFLIDHQADIEHFSQLFSEKLLAAIVAVKNALTSRAVVTLFDDLKEGFEVIQPKLEWILNNKIALAAAFTAIGVAALLAFSPVTGPVLAIAAALSTILIGIGAVNKKWDEFTAANEKARGSSDNNRDSQIQLEEALRILADSFVVFISLIGKGIYELGHLEAILLELAFKGLSYVDDGVKAIIRSNEGFIQSMHTIGTVAAAIWGAVVAPVVANVAVNVRDLWLLMQGFGSDFKVIGAGVVDGFVAIWGAIRGVIGAIQQLIDWINKIPQPGDFLPSIKVPGGGIFSGIGKGIGGIFNRASGGPASGWGIVGERGPELVRLPNGSRVFSNQESQAMGGTFNFYITADSQASDDSMRKLAKMIREEAEAAQRRASFRGSYVTSGAYTPL